jgi:hypothetical protein
MLCQIAYVFFCFIFVQIFTIEPKHILFVAKMNIKTMINFMIWYTIAIGYSLASTLPDYFIMSIYPSIVVIKLTENYLICVLEGDRRERKIAQFSSA